MIGVLKRYWFQECPPERLAAVRIIIGVFALSYTLGLIPAYLKLNQKNPDLFVPVGILSWMQQPLPDWALLSLGGVTALLGVAFLLGWHFRKLAPLFAVCFLAWLTYRNSWTMIFHSDNLLALQVLILALTPASDAWSADKQSNRQSGWEPAMMGWGLQLMIWVTVIVYFLSGVAKILGVYGWEWANGVVVRDWVAYDTMRKELLGAGFSPVIGWIFDQVWLFRIGSWHTLMVEVGAPLFLLHRRLLQFWAINAFLMHWLILVIMGITFPFFLWGAAYAAFFPVEKMGHRIEAKWKRFQATRAT